MKNLFSIILVVCCSAGFSLAQEKSEPVQAIRVVPKESLKKVSHSRVIHKKPPIQRTGSKIENQEPDATRKRPPLTNESINTSIAELQKMIDDNAGTEGFDKSGYVRRINYLESKRPQE